MGAIGVKENPMRIRALICAAAILAVPASAQSSERDIELLSGHPVYDEAAHEAAS
jgi:hypothetical protein